MSARLATRAPWSAARRKFRDVVLTIWAGFFPDLWFQAFHGVPYEGHDPEGFLRRCAANWAAFALVQGIACVRWRREPVWIAVVAGARPGDVFTDLVYWFFATHRTVFAHATLPFVWAVNLGLGGWLLRRYAALTGLTSGTPRN